MFGLSPWELLIMFLVILLLFGAKRLPEIGASLGKGIREFKGSIKEVEGEMRTEITGDSTAGSQGTEQSQAAEPQATKTEV